MSVNDWLKKFFDAGGGGGRKGGVPLGDSPVAFRVRVGKYTSVGNYRDNNEDRYFTDAGRHLYLVADGMGGQAAGEVASQLAVDLIPKYLSVVQGSAGDENQVRQAIVQAFQAVNDAIVQRAAADPNANNMGTTVVLAMMFDSKLVIAHVGDSRCYRLRGGKAEPVTTDHNLAQALFNAGTISNDELQHHRYKHVLYKYLGMKEPGNEPDVKLIDLRPGDRVLLASDGLTGSLDEKEMVEIVKRQADVDACARELVERALDNGSKDNVTCLLLAVEEGA